MTDPLLEAYEKDPYRHGSIPYTHPARLGVIARLAGLDAPPVDSARVLELGCGEGMNLLPLAERLPAGRFVGVDFSPQQIGIAESAVKAAGLANVTLLCTDLRTFEPEAAAFDYVIAHGVYSWVPDEVKERLLAIMARALTPGGIAYVSYNVHPGWGIVGSIGRSLRAHLASLPAAESELPRILGALEKAFASQVTPFAQLAREALAEMREKPAGLVVHDELASTNDPVAFLDFVQHAGRHGLGYLAEAHFAEMPWEHLPAGARQPFDIVPLGFLQQQGLLDLLGYRRFRSSLLRRGDSIALGPPDAGVIRECAVGFRMWPADNQIDLGPDTALRLVGANGLQLGVEKPAQKAFFAALCETAPARVPFLAAVRRARELLAAAAISDSLDEALMCKGVLKLFTADQCDLVLSTEREWLENEKPSALVRYQAAHGLPVVNRWHETVELSDEQRRFLAGAELAVDEVALRKSGLLF